MNLAQTLTIFAWVAAIIVVVIVLTDYEGDDHEPNG